MPIQRCEWCRQASLGHAIGCPKHPTEFGSEHEWDLGYHDGYHYSAQGPKTPQFPTYMLGYNKGKQQAEAEILADQQEQCE